jgi:sugar transferase (PEP-CTERM/EpsH1 system associated)
VRVLFLTHRLPYAPNRGDRVRAYHILEMLASRAEVDLVSFVHDREEAAQADVVRRVTPHVTTIALPRARNYARAVAALPTALPLTHALLDAPGLDEKIRDICARRRPDVVLAYCSGMARFAVRPPLDTIPFVLDLVDVDSEKWSDLAGRATLRRRWLWRWLYRREARTLGAFEARAAAAARATLVVNEREATLARRMAPLANVVVVSNGVDARGLRPVNAPGAIPQVVFCGVMNYQPNEDGMLWFVRDVWPLVRARRPDARLAIVGSDPTATLRAACAGDGAIEITGRVADVREHLWRSAIAVAPLRISRGLQNKVLEAVAAGLPTVVTTAVAAGLPGNVRPACPVADTPALFAGAVLDLLALTPDERRARAGRAFLEPLDWPTTLDPLWSLLETIVTRRPCGRILEPSERLLQQT